MKNTFLVLIFSASVTLSIAWNVCEREPRHKIAIHGTVYEWRPHKGHYRDSLRSAQGFHPTASTFYVRRVNWGYRGVMPVCDTVISDSLGNFTTELEDGEYQFYEPWQLAPLVMPMDSDGITYDTACIRKQYVEPAYVLKFVSGDSVDVVYFPKDTKFSRCRNK